MRARTAALVGITVAGIACAKPANVTPDPNDASVTASAHPDDEGVFFDFEGPKDARYTVLGSELVADATGHAQRGIPGADLPASGSLEVEVRWDDAGPRSKKLAVPFTWVAAPPRVSFAGVVRRSFGSRGIDAACSGDCAGTATFEGGQAELLATGTRGCTVRVDAFAYALDDVPTWDSHGVVHRTPKRIGVNAGYATKTMRLPEALGSDVTLSGTFECPKQPTRELHFTFGPGAAITAIAAAYQFVGQHVPRASVASSDRKSAVAVIETDGIVVGIPFEKELVRFYGAPRAVDDVAYVAVLTQTELPKRRCATEAGAFDVALRGWSLTMYDANDRALVTKRFAPPAVDCEAVAAQPIVHLAEGEDSRVVRPDGAGIDAFMRGFVR